MRRTIECSLFVAFTLLLLHPTNAAAQECETRPLAFDVDFAGYLGSEDCRVPGGICGGCESAPGEYWTIQANPGELILITAKSSQVGKQVGQVGVQTGIIVRFRLGATGVSSSGVDDCSSGGIACGRLWFIAGAGGLYTVAVGDDGYLGPHYGDYSVRAQRVTTPIPREYLSLAYANGHDVILRWSAAISALPVLEYGVEVGSAPGATDVGVGSLGPSGDSPICPAVTFTASFACQKVVRSVSKGTYFFRFRARNAYGWGPPGQERSITVTDAPTLDVFVQGPARFYLSWSAPWLEGPVSFELLVAESSTATPYAIYPLGSARSLEVTSVPRGVYYVRIRAVTAAGTTEASPAAVVTVP